MHLCMPAKARPERRNSSMLDSDQSLAAHSSTPHVSDLPAAIWRNHMIWRNLQNQFAFDKSVAHFDCVLHGPRALQASTYYGNDSSALYTFAMQKTQQICLERNAQSVLLLFFQQQDRFLSVCSSKTNCFSCIEP